MNTEAFITCAVTGAGDTTARSPHVPVTPDVIAASAIEAAHAGAAVAHIHVRDPATGAGSRDVALYAAVVDQVRAADVDVVVNLTAGMGGDLVLGGAETPLPPDDAGTDMVGATERLAHVAALRPEICTLDCGTMNFAAGGDYVMANTPDMLRAMAGQIKALGVRPELEVFDYGQLVMVKDLIDEGLIEDPVLIQLCMGIRYGAPDDPGSLLGSRVAAAARIGVLGVLDRADAAALCGHGGAGRRQRPGRPRGQPVRRAGPAGDQRRAGGARGDDP